MEQRLTQCRLKTQFAFFADKIRDYSLSRARSFVKSIDFTIDTITSEAIVLNQSWPLVTVPHFETKGHHARSLSDADVIAFCPLVSEENRVDWEAYASEQQGWIEQGQERVYGGDYSYPISPNIMENDDIMNGTLVKAQGPAPYLPVWQMSPPPFDPTVVNIDLMSDPSLKRAIQSSAKEKSK